MVHKYLISPSKLRKLPGQFSWIDQRLVRERHIDRLSHPACALYLFLLTVADAQGLSFYSELSVCQRLSMTTSDLHKARQELVQRDLVAYQQPLYQVLALDDPDRLSVPQTSRLSAGDTPMAIKDIFKHIAETLS
jgi:hypothetical protein